MCVQDKTEGDRNLAFGARTLVPAVISAVPVSRHIRHNTGQNIFCHHLSHTHDPTVSLSISVSGGRKGFDRNFKNLMAFCVGVLTPRPTQKFPLLVIEPKNCFISSYSRHAKRNVGSKCT
jgi:hypothetical protein